METIPKESWTQNVSDHMRKALAKEATEKPTWFNHHHASV